MGFVVDIVGFGGRSARLRALAQHRVLDVTEAVLDHLGVDTDDVDHQVTGDGILVFLPAALDVPRAVPRLLRGWRDLLREDNELYADQLRLRMAVVIGPVAPGPLGFVGPPATTAGRLVDSDVLRAALVDSPNSALVVLMSDALHSFVVDPADPAFAHCRVEVKEYRADGWLWVG
jgi:class 3 adenylate cyclase